MQGVENVSALMDGELDAAEASREIARFRLDAARIEAWDTYHAIGDAVRGESASATGLSPGFSQRLREKLALEPTVLAPRLRLSATAKPIQTYALSAAASVAAVAVVGWTALNILNPDAGSGTLAQAPASSKAAVVVLQPAVPSRIEPTATATVPEHMHEYLLAHQGISPTTAMQGVTPYIRTVSNVGDAPALR